MADAAEMLEVAGFKNVKTYDAGYTFGQGIHEMGTAEWEEIKNLGIEWQ